jgi:hypothetical protein
MDMYWAHVLEKEYNNHTKKSQPKKESSTNHIIRDILCSLCGQNKYCCVCDRLSTYQKFDSKQSSSTQDNITNNASQKQGQETISSGDHQKEK